MEDTDPTQEMVYVDIGGVDSLGRIVERELLTFATAPSRARRLVRDGDVIVSTVRTYLRAIAPISDPEPGMVVSTAFAVVRPADDLTTDYAAYALRAPYFVERVVANSKGVSFPDQVLYPRRIRLLRRALRRPCVPVLPVLVRRAIHKGLGKLGTQLNLNTDTIGDIYMPLPGRGEQQAIVQFLDRETARIDALVAKVGEAIDRLKELRTALISAAVTGRIDVREAAA